jgi:hypothetical protein
VQPRSLALLVALVASAPEAGASPALR